MIIPVFPVPGPSPGLAPRGILSSISQNREGSQRTLSGLVPEIPEEGPESGLVWLVRYLFTGVVLERNHAAPAVVLVFRAPDLDLR
jgi:hypothetical protein